MFNYMVERQDLDDIFRALSDLTRRAMVQQMATGRCTVSELSQPHAMSLAAVSKHIKVLEGAGLVRREIEGRRHHCSLDARPLAHAVDWLKRYASFWDERLGALDELLALDSEPKRSTRA